MTRQKSVSRDRYGIFEHRADEYYEMMEEAYKKKKYEVCASNATHCAISSVDALSVLALGRKSSGRNHNEAILLLKEIKATNEEERAKISNCLYELLELKTPVEYGDKETSKATAERAMHLCKKIYLFVTEELDKLKRN